jgi:hypothetical protein
MNAQHTGVIPQIIFEETHNHIREKMIEAVQVYNSAGRLLAELSGHNGRTPLESAAQSLSEDQLRKRIEDVNLHIVPYDEQRLAALVKRALLRRKPFDSNGQKGFRDAILWETVLKIAGSTEDQVILVTRNSKDFGVRNSLNDDLLADLAAIGRVGKVVIVDGIDQLLIEIVNPTLETAQQVLELMKTRQYQWLDPAEYVEARLPNAVVAINETLRHRRWPLYTRYGHDFIDVFLGSSLKSPVLRTIDAYHIGTDRLSISISFEASGTLHGESSIEYVDGLPPFTSSTAEIGIFQISASLILNEAVGTILEESFDCNKIQVEQVRRP